MRRLSSIFSSSFGNILEWYDFGLFTIFSSLFSQIFFPAQSPYTAMLATIAIFSIGFFCRPLGALIFGYLGDKKGRAITLRLSILMIALPTLLIGFLPSYDQVGILAPIFLVIIRMWQGISIGGEYSGNMIYLAEIAPDDFRATFTAFASMGANFGILLAAFIGIITTLIFTTQTLNQWGWRIPYLISGIFCLFIYKFRLQLSETLVFDNLKEKKLIAENPIKVVFQKNFYYLLRTLGMVCMGSTFYFFCFIYIPIFLSQNIRLTLQHISLIMSTLISILIIFIPIAGYICDKVGRRKMLLINATLITLSVVPGFYLLQQDNMIVLFLVLLIFTLFSAFEQGTTSIALVENFPLPARYTGLSLGYNLGNGFLGGNVPIVCEWLTSTTKTSLAPAFYIASCAAITGFVVYFFVPETRYEKLTKLS